MPVAMRSAATGLTLVFVTVGLALEVWAPQCFDMEQCLQYGVDNSTSTIVMGLLTSAWMFSLAIHLWSIKCCSPRHGARDDSQGNIRPSGIWAQGYMGLSIFLSTLGRMIQPNAGVGQRVYWSLTAVGTFFLALSVYCFGYFAMRTAKQRLRVFCCGCCNRIGLTTGLVLKLALVVFGAGVACAAIESETARGIDPAFDGNNTITDQDVTNDQQISMSLRSMGNIFDHDQTRRLWRDKDWIDSPELQVERVAQDIFHWGNLALALACFFFWHATCKMIRKAIRRREQKLKTFEGQYLISWGMRSMTAAHLLPWVSCTIGQLFPVWVVLLATFKHMYWLDVWMSLHGGIVYNYGLSLMALLAHNWTLTLPYHGPEPPPTPVRFNEAVFHDLTLGIFERNRKEKATKNAIFHDLTLGIFEGFDTSNETTVPKPARFATETDVEQGNKASNEEDLESETTISLVDHQSFGQTRIFQAKQQEWYR